VARLGAVADWWRCSWPMANMLVCLCSCQWWIFWIYLVTANLFSLYLIINFMFHTMLDAIGNILRVYYKSMKCDVLFSRGSMSTLFRCGEHVFHVCVKCSFCLQQCKNYKNQMSFSRVMITNVLPCFFMNHSVYVSAFMSVIILLCFQLQLISIYIPVCCWYLFWFLGTM